MSTKFEMHSVPGIYPVADAFAGTAATDIIEVQGEGILFTIFKGVGTTGTSVITVLACDDTTPSNTSAVPFKYRISTTPDTWGEWTDVANTGFTTTAGSNQLYEVWAAAEAQASTGYAYVKLVATESVNDPVVGAVLAQVVGGRYKEAPESYID
jgi:hypothetical protein